MSCGNPVVLQQHKYTTLQIIRAKYDRIYYSTFCCMIYQDVTIRCHMRFSVVFVWLHQHIIKANINAAISKAPKISKYINKRLSYSVLCFYTGSSSDYQSIRTRILHTKQQNPMVKHLKNNSTTQ